ncbi:MAG: hypothetical protein PHT26_03610, partial [Lentimicrobiaceae bacterium]|nr:hypothetical protein [Lentimicrobiaceae bacterium]
FNAGAFKRASLGVIHSTTPPGLNNPKMNKYRVFSRRTTVPFFLFDQSQYGLIWWGYKNPERVNYFE